MRMGEVHKRTAQNLRICVKIIVPNFLIVTAPEDYALISALYRTSIDGRRWMYQAIVSDDGIYNIPDNFTSRSVEILQVYLKSLGIRMSTIIDDDEFIREPEHMHDSIVYQMGNDTIFCTSNEKYYLQKIYKTYQKYLKKNPGGIYDADEVWEWIVDHIPFKKKHLTDRMINIFKNHIEAFTVGELDK